MILDNGMETIERGSTTWRLIINRNFARVATDTSLDNYYTKDECNDTFELKGTCYTKTESDDRYVTSEELTDNYYDRTASDDRYALKTDLDNYYDKTESDNRYVQSTDLDNYYDKTESDSRYLQDISGSTSNFSIDSNWSQASGYVDTAVYKTGSIIVFQGALTTSTSGATTLGTIASGYRPNATLRTSMDSDVGPVGLEIGSDGVATVQVPSGATSPQTVYFSVTYVI